jgi:hypothetical protein
MDAEFPSTHSAAWIQPVVLRFCHYRHEYFTLNGNELKITRNLKCVKRERILNINARFPNQMSEFNMPSFVLRQELGCILRNQYVFWRQTNKPTKYRGGQNVQTCRNRKGHEILERDTKHPGVLILYLLPPKNCQGKRS